MSCDVTGWDGSSQLTRPALGCQVLVKLREDVDAGPGQMFRGVQGPPVTKLGRGLKSSIKYININILVFLNEILCRRYIVLSV